MLKLTAALLLILSLAACSQDYPDNRGKQGDARAVYNDDRDHSDHDFHDDNQGHRLVSRQPKSQPRLE